MKSKYFDMPPEAYLNSPMGGGIRSLYYLAKASQKQALQIVVPPTILLRIDHDNMFVYTKAATKWVAIKKDAMSPKLILSYIKDYMDRGSSGESKNINNRIKSSVYPKYVIRYGTRVDRNNIHMFYKLNDVYQQVLEDWGKYDLAIQPFIISKSRKASWIRWEVDSKARVKTFAITSERDVSNFPYLEKDRIFNIRKDPLKLGLLRVIEENKDNSELINKNLPLSQIPNHELINHFWVSTEIEEPEISIMACRAMVYPRAEKMAKTAVWVLESTYFINEYRVKYWIVDFIESADGLTYFSQVKSFRCEKK